MGNKSHWENVFATKTEKEVSWHQPYPQTSIDFFNEWELPLDAKIIDIGGGDSYFIDALLALGYTNIHLLDISENAIARAKKRLGKKATSVTFIVSDVLDFIPEMAFDLWYDRACFHFLVDPIQIAAYKMIVLKAVASQGKMILGTFSEIGPLKCSGLEITQYSIEDLKAAFADHFEAVSCQAVEHHTPFGTLQNFTFCNFKKKQS